MSALKEQTTEAEKAITRSMVGMFYVLKDETCGPCKGRGVRSRAPEFEWPLDAEGSCPYCKGSGFITVKVELSAAMRQLSRAGVISLP